MSAKRLLAIDGERVLGGWEELWAADRWPLRKLPHSDLRTIGIDGSIEFSDIAQPWLKEAAKRWVRARVLAGTTPGTMRNYVLHVRAFSGWLAQRRPAVTSPAGITRSVLEDWMLAVHASGLSQGGKRPRVGALRVFLQEQWNDGLRGLPRDAAILSGEVPRVEYLGPRGIERAVFEQFIDPAKLALLDTEQHRTVILLLALTGLRVSSIVTLPRDALAIGSDGHPYLRYLNVKFGREAVIPIGPEICEQLHRQQDHLARSDALAGSVFLLPSPAGSAGQGGTPSRSGHISAPTVRNILSSYVRTAEIRDSQGRLALWVHPHRFRHHLATSMVNDGVPLPVIQRVLDHATIAMTSHYAHLDDETVKREIASFHERVNVRGERIALPSGRPLEEAASMKERIGAPSRRWRTGMRMPLVQSCPHPNTCLSWRTSSLTAHSARSTTPARRHRTLREHANQNENVRLLELLERDEESLHRILDAWTPRRQHRSRASAVDIDMIELAARRTTNAKDQKP